MKTISAFLVVLTSFTASAAVLAQPAEKPYVVEYYYKVKWGYLNEFLELYRKNHYPILKRQKEMGRIIDMSATVPVYHAGESSRWDFRFTITYKSAAVANDDFDESEIIKKLYPDQERFSTEEKRRFEILLEHMDVPINVDDLKSW